MQTWLNLPVTCSIGAAKAWAIVKIVKSAVFSTCVIMECDARWIESKGEESSKTEIQSECLLSPLQSLLPPSPKSSGPGGGSEGRHSSWDTLSQKAKPRLFVAISSVPVGGGEGGRAGLHGASY